MARVTVEDAVKQVGNRFDLVLVAAPAKSRFKAKIPWSMKRTTSRP